MTYSVTITTLCCKELSTVVIVSIELYRDDFVVLCEFLSTLVSPLRISGNLDHCRTVEIHTKSVV